MVHYCSVPRCRGKWTNSLNLPFHRFPKDVVTRQLWQMAVRCSRPPSDTMKVCGRHFKEEDYQIHASGCMRLKKSAVPSLHLLPKVDAFSQTDNIYGMNDVSSINQSYSAFEEESKQHPTLHIPELPPYSTENLPWEKVEIKEELDLFIPAIEVAECENVQQALGSEPEWYGTMNDEDILFLSGMSKYCFQNLFILLTRESLTLPSCNMSAQDQLLVTLSVYRHNFPFRVLMTFFRIELHYAHSVFAFWTHHICKTLKLYFGVKREKQEQPSASVGLVKVPLMRSSSSFSIFGESSIREIPLLQSLVIIGDDETVLYCSKLHGMSTSVDSLIQDPEFQQCAVLFNTIKVFGTFDLKNILPDKNINILSFDNVVPGEEPNGFTTSSDLLSSRFECLLMHYKIVFDGVPSSFQSMSNEIFFNCMMLRNFQKKPLPGIAKFCS